eukprot:TRINITY_DN7818_c0_g1_i3.p1 TRINITY_DN7818_c0_g1~~TRINITY_DN7818_c0_g1_i3.p1  ORF type:complete len:819 (+),score=140.40 TRINITY_DN7818_c0_g1_i3:1930-4386(+)
MAVLVLTPSSHKTLTTLSCDYFGSPNPLTTGIMESVLIVTNVLDGRRYRLVIKGSLGKITGAKVKKYMTSHVGASAASMMLRFNGREMTETSTAGALGIVSGDNIMLEPFTMSPRSGVPGMGHYAPSSVMSSSANHAQLLEAESLDDQRGLFNIEAGRRQHEFARTLNDLDNEMNEHSRQARLLENDLKERQLQIRKIEEERQSAAAEKRRLEDLRQLELERQRERDEELRNREQQLMEERSRHRELELHKLELERKQQLLEQQRTEAKLEKEHVERERREYEEQMARQEAEIRERQQKLERERIEHQRRERELERDKAHFSTQKALEEHTFGRERELDDMRLNEIKHAGYAQSEAREPRMAPTPPMAPLHDPSGSRPMHDMYDQRGTSMPDARPYEAKPLDTAKLQPERREAWSASGSGAGMVPPAPTPTPQGFPAPIPSAGTGPGMGFPPIPPSAGAGMALQSPRGPVAPTPGTAVGGGIILGGPDVDCATVAEANLEDLAQHLGQPLKFDASQTCVVDVDDKHTIMISYDKETEGLYIYSSLLCNLPKDANLKLQLYEMLLEGALLGRDMAGGGVGLSLKDDFILMCTSVSLHSCQTHALRLAVPAFSEALRRWRKKIKDLLMSPKLQSLPTSMQQMTYPEQPVQSVPAMQVQAPTPVQSSSLPPVQTTFHQPMHTPVPSVPRTDDAISEGWKDMRSPSAVSDDDDTYAIIGVELTDGVTIGGVHTQYNGGVIVVRVKGPALVAGMLENDIIKFVNGKRISNLISFQEVTAILTPEQPAVFIIERNGQELSLEVCIHAQLVTSIAASCTRIQKTG